jgi:hypothetical protein
MAKLASSSLLLAPLVLAACELNFGTDPDDTQPPVVEGDADGDGYDEEQDCDDDDPEVFPGADEWCNGIDDDCDGETDEYDAIDVAPWYPDGDGDGYGLTHGALAACEAPSGYAALSDDCDDDDASVYPGAEEICGDGVRNDCDGGAPPCMVSGDIHARNADATLYGQVDGDNAGHAVAGAGDVNADGYDDLLIGAPGLDEGADDAGVSYLVLGPLTSNLDLALADARLIGKEAEGGVGSAVAGAGDVNADGYDDLLIGAPYLDDGSTDAGAAFLVLGPIAGDLDIGSADATITGTARIDWTGWSVAGAGDVDGDGHHDLLIGAPYSDKGGSNAGAAVLMLGPVTGALSINNADAQLVGEAEQDNAGLSVAGAGDVDGDGLDDLIVGAPGSAQAGTNAGAAYLVLGPVSEGVELNTADARLVGEAAYDGAGGAVAGAGDVDGDGLSDLLVGASTHDAGGSDAGAAYLLLGTTRGYVSMASAHAKLVGEAMSDQAGSTLAGAGDTDGDGHADILVGSWSQDSNGIDAGASYLVLGPVTGEFALGTAFATFIGDEEFDRAGSAIAGAGDVDGDGTGDLLVGAPINSEFGTERGAAYLVSIVDW